MPIPRLPWLDRARLYDLWHSLVKLIYYPLLVGGIPLCFLWLFYRLPVAGIAIGGLGLVGAIVAVRGENVTPWHKPMWALMSVLLLVVEVRAISHDRKEQDESHQRELKRTLDSITGGESFAYVLPSTDFQNVMLNVVTQGESPLRDMYIEMQDLDEAAKTKVFSIDAIHKFTTYFTPLPYTSNKSVRNILTTSLPTTDTRRLHFTFFALNGVWGEKLTMRKVGDRWLMALEVTNDKDGPKPSQTLLYEYAHPGFPSKDGKPDW